MDPIKEAFKKVKEDLVFLNEQLAEQKKYSLSNREYLKEIPSILDKLKEQNRSLSESLFKTEKRFSEYDSVLDEFLSTTKAITEKLEFLSKEVFLIKEVLKDNSTDRQQKRQEEQDVSTHLKLFNALNSQNKGISTGNGGVPTDRQTDRQTDQQTNKSSHNLYDEEKINEKQLSKKNASVEEVSEILDSLDNLKKELRLKFKRLTSQEIAVFSTIYQLEEEGMEVDYKTIAEKLNLTESSIRDYVGRLIKKDIPVEKIKVNNKSIVLSISRNLKKIASLSTILKLRDL
jgi:hypothetical protein